MRVPLGGRRVSGWIVRVRAASDGTGEPRDRLGGSPRALREVLTLAGWGPEPAVVELAQWAAWRWAAPVAMFLAAASPPRRIRELPPRGRMERPVGRRGETGSPSRAPDGGGELEGWSALEAILDAEGAALFRLGPAHSPLPWLVRLAGPVVEEGRTALLLLPQADAADRLAAWLARRGWPVARVPAEWDRARAGGRVVIGSRGAAWAPAPTLGLVVVVDAHDRTWRETRRPHWDAVEVTRERARRAGARWVGISPTPTVGLVTQAPLVRTSVAHERRGWARIQVVDLRREDPRHGLLTPALVALVTEGRPGEPVVVVHNRPGQATLLACRTCREVLECPECGGALAEDEEGLVCPRCRARPPAFCPLCRGLGRVTLRPGVARLAAGLARLVPGPVVTVTATTEMSAASEAGCVVGTEAALRRLRRARGVALADFDFELLAPRAGALEESLGLLGLASRLVGGRAGGRLLLQTRLVDHPVVRAARAGDPSAVLDEEAALRRALGLPPYRAMARALFSGAGSEAGRAGGELDPATGWLARLERRGVEVHLQADGSRVLVGPSNAVLADALAAETPPAGVRVEVDPPRL